MRLAKDWGYIVKVRIFWEGQIIWARHRFSQKTNERICFVCREKQKSKQTNSFICSFFGRIYSASICFRLYLILVWNKNLHFQNLWRSNSFKIFSMFLCGIQKNNLAFSEHNINWIMRFPDQNSWRILKEFQCCLLLWPEKLK